jgi:hypothetical protein
MRRIAAIALLVVLQAGVAHGQACPSLPGDRLKFVDVFDGTPEEQAFLMADSATDDRGVWSLGYVYDAGRFVTVRCKYEHGRVVDLRIPDRIAQCSYTTDATAGLRMTCR